MRDLIISIVCLLILIVPWCIYDKYSADTADTYKQMINNDILPALEENDWKTANKEFGYIARDWDRFKKISAFFIDSEAINETDRLVSRVYYYIKLKDASSSAGEIAYLQYSFDCLHENELPTLGNIF